MDNEKFRRAADAIAGECVAVRLRMLNRVVTNLYDEALRSLGLKVSQLHILVVTAKARRGPARQGLRPLPTRRVHAQPERGADARRRLAGSRAGRRCPHAVVPPDATGAANARARFSGLGAGTAEGRATPGRKRGRSAGQYSRQNGRAVNEAPVRFLGLIVAYTTNRNQREF